MPCSVLPLPSPRTRALQGPSTQSSRAWVCDGGTQELYADSYTLSGCHYDDLCGVFTRVEAHCATGSGARCPGGASAAGNADPTLCDGAPVYQQTSGWVLRVLLRLSEQGGGTRWYVSQPPSLDDCEFHHGNDLDGN